MIQAKSKRRSFSNRSIKAEYFMHKLFLNTITLFSLLSLSISSQPAVASASASIIPTPIYPTPTQRQLNYQRSEVHAFFHFSLNAYYGREWGDGTEDPKKFNPVNFDPKQWADAAESMGAKMAVIVVKHHSGFSIYDTAVSDYDVASSSWKNGKGDMLRELVDEFRDRDIKLGFYVSPWDRHDPVYGTEAYNDNFYQQWEELLTNYGETHEIWLDGAGSKNHDFDWQKLFTRIRELAPDAVFFNHSDVRWVGNEAGYAFETEWSVQLADSLRGQATYSDKKEAEFAITLNGTKVSADAAFLDENNPSTENEQDLIWWPSETDTPIRHCWFNTCDEIKTAEEVVDIYFNSVGRNSTLLLNFSPDLTGKVPADEIARATTMRDTVLATFAKNLLADASVTASNTRKNNDYFSGKNLLDQDLSTYWATDDKMLTGSVDFNIGHKISFDVIQIREHIELGQRIERFVVESKVANGVWAEVASGTTVGNRRLLRLNQPVVASDVRLRIIKARGLPVISEFGLYKFKMMKYGVSASPASGYFRGETKVSLSSKNNAEVFYTVDGSEPTQKSPKYQKPISIKKDTTIKTLSDTGQSTFTYKRLIERQHNLAMSGQASQSSTEPGNTADKAINGKVDTNLLSESSTLTSTVDLTEPWWEVDLGKVNVIEQIRLHQHNECCKLGLKGSIVIVSDVPFNSLSKFDVLNQTNISEFIIDQTTASQTLDIGRTGRYVRIYGNGYEQLSLTEVQVIGSKERLAANAEKE